MKDEAEASWLDRVAREAMVAGMEVCTDIWGARFIWARGWGGGAWLTISCCCPNSSAETANNKCIKKMELGRQSAAAV